MTDRRRLTGQGVRTSVDEHRATRAIEAAATNAAWINAALVQCQKDVDLARAALAAENHKGAVTCTYDAIRTAVECHMNAAGLRISNQPGAHKVAIDYAAEKMAGVFDETRLLQYEQLRVLRHRAEYPFSSSMRLSIGPKDSAVAVALAAETVNAVIAAWSREGKWRR